EKDWQKALEQAQRLEQVSGEHMGDVMAQFCCEMAEEAISANDEESARRQLKQARRHDPRCIRARFILAKAASQEGDTATALELYEEIAELDPDYIPEILEPYISLATRGGESARGRAMLDEWSGSYKGISLILKLTDFLAEEQGGAVAGRYLVETLTSKPSVKGLDHLIDLKAEGYLDAESSDDILKAVTTRLMSRQPDYRCRHCGFSGNSHHWQCPSCRKWSTTRKIQGVLGE
ncbi:MAG: tetratricopeptide repeat protein, partial [Gammaproteobacteria bacterium]|nr:tetratricopeptide repeat protein [Gammaproteobacteria bacterium]